ncbi:tyrosine-type recombinase/integrase [Thermodesulfobacteriota bacterium]
MSVFKDKNRKVWIAKFKFQYKQYKKEGFKTRAKAWGWEMQKRNELKNPPAPETTPLTFSQVSTMYLEDCQSRFQKNTWRQKAFVYRNFISFINDDPDADSIFKQTFVEYLRHRKGKVGNIAANRDLKEFKVLFNWCIRQEILFKNPCVNIEDYPEEPKVKYVPPAKDINLVIMAADFEDKDLIQTLYHTAGRISEILNLTWEDINFEQKWVRLWTRKRRGGELQEDKIAMTDTLCGILKRRWNNRDPHKPYIFHHEDGSKITYQQKRYTMKKLCEKAKVKTFGFHAIRHHVATILADSGKASLSQIQKMLRHRRSTTTDNYIKTLDPQLRQVANVLDEQGNFEKENEKGTIRGTI